ncbi:MAG TPA: LptA/OstA family protein, partial [Acetobacteraceae bacterium]|nr:LptA/OstA family protein [Acetobacteraceae bacterium]
QGIDLSKGGPIEVTARDGIEWRQNEQVVIARGDARAVRGDTTVIADTLTAHYRKKAGAQDATPASTGPSITPGGDTGSNEIYRLEADGNVKIFNPQDIAVGDHAIYDIDQAVLLLTGKNMSVTTPTQVYTARDTLEYWSQKHMAVARGLATVTTSDGRRLAGDVLVGYTDPNKQAGPQPAKAQATDPLGGGGKLQRAEAFGNVEVRTATETIRGDRAVYVADTQMARIAGHVRITRGQNQANGDEALVNMQTGVSTLIHDPGGRVQGVVVPNDPTNSQGNQGKTPPSPPKK